MKPLLSVRDLHYAYPGGIEAIRGVTLDLPPGERVALLGENGSGKTTLARLLVGLLRPTRGTILLRGRDTSRLSTHDIVRDVGLVFQNPDHQIFLERVWDEVAFGPQTYGQSPPEVEERVETELRRFGLWEARNRLPSALSGGERKAVAFASSFALQPAVLLLDEPTKGMDYGRKQHLATVSRSLTRDGRTVVFITHDVEFAYESTERAVVLRRGRVFLEGRTADVLAHPSLAEAGLHRPESPRLLALLGERGINPRSRLFRDVTEYLRGSE
ncbi:MAG: energy-coupling factor ABC transporter ATP-binding protein [Thermoplasmata archaeon]